VGDSADCGHAAGRRQRKLTDGSRDDRLIYKTTNMQCMRLSLVDLLAGHYWVQKSYSRQNTRLPNNTIGLVRAIKLM
jgi:hypothetical protein